MSFFPTKIRQLFLKWDVNVYDHYDVPNWMMRPFGEFFGEDYRFLPALKTQANKIICFDNNVTTEEKVTVVPKDFAEGTARDFKLTVGSYVNGQEEGQRHSLHHVFTIYENQNENWTHQFSIGLNAYGRVDITSFYTTEPKFIENVGGPAEARAWFMNMLCLVMMMLNQFVDD